MAAGFPEERRSIRRHSEILRSDRTGTRFAKEQWAATHSVPSVLNNGILSSAANSIYGRIYICSFERNYTICSTIRTLARPTMRLPRLQRKNSDRQLACWDRASERVAWAAGSLRCIRSEGLDPSNLLSNCNSEESDMIPAESPGNR